MKGRRHRQGRMLFLLLAALAFSACQRAEQGSGKDGMTPAVIPTVTSAEVPEETVTPPPEETTPDPGMQMSVSPTPAPVIPEEIVDTSAEPYTYEEMCADLELLAYAYPEMISVMWEGYSADGREIPAVRFGSPDAEAAVFVQAAIHGREHLTTQLVMKQLETYAKEYDAGTFHGRTYREIFSEVALVVVPMTNPDGVSISQLGTESIRSGELRALVESFYERDGAGVAREYFYRRYKANANGVDLNRNFAYGWEEYGGPSVPAADRYKGTAPASEPETQLLIALTEREPVRAAVSYHATGSLLYWDFGQGGEIRERCLTLVETVRDVTGYRIVYAASDKQDEAGYCEWAVGIMGIPEVTIEIGTVAAPLPVSEFADVWKRNREVLAAVAEQVMDELGEMTE